MPTFGINSFADRNRQKSSGLTHWEFSDEELLKRVSDNWERRRPGYRDGVVLVPVPPEGFKAATRTLQEGDVLQGVYKARRAGETPRKTVGYKSPIPVEEAKVTPQSVDIVLYHRDTLAEADEFITADWDVITVLGKFCPSEEDEPMPPDTLMANHFLDDGGTSTEMTPAKFEAALRRSYFYWRDKALLG